MNRKISKFCFTIGMVFLAVVVGVALLFALGYEIFLMAVLLLLLVSVVSYFSKKHLWLNIGVAVLSYVLITGAVLTGMYPLIAVGIVLAAVCAITEFALKARGAKQ